MKTLGLMAFLALMSIRALPGAPEGILNLDEVPPEGVTQVWSPLFQGCWDKLGAMQAGELREVVPPNPLITRLEEFEWRTERVMPEGGYAVFAGPATEAFARETAASIRERFGVRVDPGRMPPATRGRSAYGILLRELRFEKKFFRSEKRALAFRSRTGVTRRVEFFGTAGGFSAGYRKHVDVLLYEVDPAGSPSFALSVATDREDERLIAHLPDQACSFGSAIERVKKAIEEPLAGPFGTLEDGSLHREDVVKIPYVTVDMATDFAPQLRGDLHFAGEPLPWRVANAFQQTRFELFEAGASVRIDAGVGLEPFGPPPKPRPVVPRSFVCDRPFFVFLWREDAAWPYLAAWVDGGECLKPFVKDQHRRPTR